jgi:hypothetical protein
MSLTRIQRINIDSTNFSAQQGSNVGLQVSLQNPIVKVPQEYNVVLEKCEIPISQIPLNFLNDPLYIMIDYPPTAPDHPVLQKKLNIFTIQGAYRSVTEFIDYVNSIIHTNLLPSLSCGSFGYNPETFRIEFKFGDAVQRATQALGVEVWFDSRLTYLLDGIEGLFGSTPDLSISTTVDMLLLDWTTFVGSSDTVVIKAQEKYLLPRLFGFKSIRIHSTLPTRPYMIYDQSSNKAVPSDLLAEIMLDSQNFVEGRTNQLYVPTNLIYNEMIGVTELKDFQFSFYIHYKNGVNHGLTVSQNDYLSLTLAFYKI